VSMNKKVERFLSADDIVFDQKMAVYDIYGSLGHLEGSLENGMVDESEYNKMKKGLIKILTLAKKNLIIIKVADEDVHTVVEKLLNKEAGSVAGKLHSLRSRNDQISVDIKLYSKQELLVIMKQVLDLVAAFLKFANQHKTVAMPGYTHMQKAMVSSVGLWAESFAANLLDDFEMLKNAYDLNNQSPLGSAAGYGVPLPINRELVAKSLGFAKVQDNPLYCQNSRGKTELAIVHGLLQTMQTINKFASDTLLFAMSEFGYFKLPDSFLTGSSIMVQKKNYDVLELLRAQYSAVVGSYQHLAVLIDSLPSGYNRDFQEIKKPLFASFETTNNSLAVALEVVNNLKPNREKLASSITPDLLVINEVYALVQDGTPFRKAYQKIGEQYQKNQLKIKARLVVPTVDVKKHNHQLKAFSNFVSKEQSKQNKCWNKLVE